MSSERPKKPTLPDERGSMMWSWPNRLQRRRSFWRWLLDVLRGRR